MPKIQREQWDAFQKEFVDASLYQTSAWGELKSQFGWEYPEYIRTATAGAQILIKQLPLGIRFAYIPKGPLGMNWLELWDEIDAMCHDEGIDFLQVEPDVCEPAGEEFYRQMGGFSLSKEYIQPLNTMCIDLNGTEKDWMARISRNNRRFIRKAKENGLVVSETEKIESLYNLIEKTADRHEFVFRSLDYYQKAYDTFVRCGNGVLLTAIYEGRPLAAFLLFSNGSRIWAVHGGSIEDKNTLYPNYFLYWETIRWSAAHGFNELDLLGIANEKRIEEVDDPGTMMGGIYNFKRRFGANLVRSVGMWERIYNPVKYRLYRSANRMMNMLDYPIIEDSLNKIIGFIRK